MTEWRRRIGRGADGGMRWMHRGRGVGEGGRSQSEGQRGEKECGGM